VAANCWVVPRVMLAAAGVTAIDTKAGGPTVNAAEPLIVPEVAVIVALPCATDKARPALLTVATVVEDELQVTDEVRLCVLPLV
jgi:hypothetical protein